MKRIKHIGLGLIVSFIAAVGVASAASAVWSPNFKVSNDTVILAAGDEHKGSMYATGDQITIDGTVTGSLYCAGGTVAINGTVQGDVLCAGQKVIIDGKVLQDVRAAGQFVEVGGTIGGSLTALGQDVRLTDTSSIARDVNGGAQQFTMNGNVGRDVVVGTQLLAVNGKIGGNVDVGTQKVQFGDQASVAGNFNYGSQKQLSFDESKVQGSVSFNPNPEAQNRNNGGKGLLAGIGALFIFSLAVSALVVVLAIPRFMNRSSEIFTRQMPMTVLLGFATIFGGPIIVGLLLFSVIFAPIGLVLLFGWLAIVFLSGIFFAYWVGSELLSSQNNAIIRMLGGMIVVLILYLIPFINLLAMFVALVVGSGIIVATLTNGYRRPDYMVMSKKPVLSKRSAK